MTILATSDKIVIRLIHTQKPSNSKQAKQVIKSTHNISERFYRIPLICECFYRIANKIIISTTILTKLTQFANVYIEICKFTNVFIELRTFLH